MGKAAGADAKTGAATSAMSQILAARSAVSALLAATNPQLAAAQQRAAAVSAAITGSTGSGGTSSAAAAIAAAAAAKNPLLASNPILAAQVAALGGSNAASAAVTKAALLAAAANSAKLGAVNPGLAMALAMAAAKQAEAARAEGVPAEGDKDTKAEDRAGEKRRRSRSRSRSPYFRRRGRGRSLSRSPPRRRSRSPGEWGPLKEVRVIKERATGFNKGFCFVDLETVEAAKALVEGGRAKELKMDDRLLLFHYSKPLQGAEDGGALADSSSGKPLDWVCPSCGVNNFARRSECFKCVTRRPANPVTVADRVDAGGGEYGARGRGGGEWEGRGGGRAAAVAVAMGPDASNVLIVRGLDDSVHEESLRQEFSQHGSVTDVRMMRDKITLKSRGFAFVTLANVDQATRAMLTCHNKRLFKGGPVMRVAYARGPNHGVPSTPLADAATAAYAAAAGGGAAEDTDVMAQRVWEFVIKGGLVMRVAYARGPNHGVPSTPLADAATAAYAAAAGGVAAEDTDVMAQ
ncbi:unnamed protein product, partial [Closterium sp. NIES-65]